MPQRRANDAQVERFLQALTSREYRQALARKLSNVTTDKLPAKGTDKRRDYDSAMRRFERYVAPEGKQRRSFSAAPAVKRAPVIAAARRIPAPVDVKPIARPLPPPLPSPRPRPSFYADIPPVERDEDDDEDDFEPSAYPTDLYDLRALLTYYDGDASEAAEQLADASGYGARLQRRMTMLLELAESGVDILGMDDAGALGDAYKRLLRSLPIDDQEDIEDFNSLLHNLPDWQIEMIIADMQNTDSTFADWIDAWRDADMDMDTDENDYWQLWREAYARAKK